MREPDADERTESILPLFDAIMESTDKKLAAYDAPEPTIDEIVTYVDTIRAQRASEDLQ